MVSGGDDGIRFSRELHARSSTVANVHRKFALYRFPFESASWVTDFLQYLLLGGDDGIRTHDPLLAGQVLSQLSYTPINMGFCFLHFLNKAYLLCLVGPSGLEPPTSCLSGTRSNLLSYEPMWLVWYLSHLSFFGLGRKFYLPPYQRCRH